MSEHEYDVRDLFRSTNKLLMGGFALLIMVVLAIGLISNSGRLFAKGAGDSVEIQTRNQARTACITDLRSAEANAYGLETDAVINRLAVLDGTDPRTGKPIELVERDGEMVPNPGVVAALAKSYTDAGLEARDLRIEAAQDLKQPRLDELCGTPVTHTDQITD